MREQPEIVNSEAPPPRREDWAAYDRMKERIREIYQPVEAERKISKLLEIVRL